MSWAEIVAAAEAIRSNAATREARLAELRMTGIGWATVDAERAFGELATVLGEATWAPQARDALLGAFVWRRTPSPSPADPMALFVVEPDSEGRLAAHLARFGEGVGAVYLAGRGEGDRLVPVDRRWGPWVIVRGRSG